MVTDGVIVRFGKLLRLGKEFRERDDDDVAGVILIPALAITVRGDCNIFELLLVRYRGIPLMEDGDDDKLLLLPLLRL